VASPKKKRLFRKLNILGVRGPRLPEEVEAIPLPVPEPVKQEVKKPLKAKDPEKRLPRKRVKKSK
jgi:hypothetical protein